jgi:predicted O-methyltransferase YrrM
MTKAVEMLEMFKRAQWQARADETVDLQVFTSANPLIFEELSGLWRKYHAELVEFSEAYSRKYRSVTAAGFSAVFGDVEGELLYILVRELKPELIYEISPNSGCSTNYLLAAVTRNGNGRVEGFEIESSFNGIPTRDAIAANQVELCDFGKYNLNVGDARRTVLEKLKLQTPDFCLIDSWHEDIFAEFYVHQLLPRVRGTVLVQDIAHFDPRPEWSTEAGYLLTHLQLTGTELVSIATYEDLLNASGARNGLIPRRPKRSNSIVIHLGENPAPASKVPHDRYQAAWQGRVDEQYPAICDILSMWFGRATLSHKMADALVTHFQALDVCQKVLTLELLVRGGYSALARQLLPTIELAAVRGAELPLSLAHVAGSLGIGDLTDTLARTIHQAAADPSLATGYRQVLALAELEYRWNRPKQARATFNAAVDILKRGDFNASKITADLAAFCIRHPVHFTQLRELGLDGRQTLRAATVAGRRMLRAAAARALKRLRA